MHLRSMFDSVVESYDVINRLLTLGLDDFWRNICAKECATGKVIVDLCCGTAENTLHIQRRAPPEASVLGVDFSKAMLMKAVEKRSQNEKVDYNKADMGFILADSTFLPFRDGCIDRVGISFSFRNLVYRNPRANISIQEVYRTLRKGGKFVCVETSQPSLRPISLFYHMYLRKILPLIGGLVSKRKLAYRYLAVSAINFPRAEEISDLLLRAGFRKVSFKHLTLGLVAIHISVK